MKTRIVALALAMLMILSLVPAAFASELEHVTLDWYVCEDQKPDQDTVFAELNKYFKEKINATINFHFVPATEYGSNVSTKINAKQQMDIVNVNGQLSFVDYAKKDAFLPLDELLEKYAPKTYASLDQKYWDVMRLEKTLDDGTTTNSIYGIPSNKELAALNCVIYNEDMMKELGIDIQSYSYKNTYDLLPLFYEIAEKRAELMPDEYAEMPYVMREFPGIKDYSPAEDLIYDLVGANIPGAEAYAGMGSGETAFCYYMTDEYEKYVKQVRKLIDDGIVPADVWWWDTSRTYTTEGKLAISSFGSGYLSVAKNHVSDLFNSNMLASDSVVMTTNYVHQAANCISFTSKNPERAMMALELINTDPYVATMLRFGIEGTHYNKNADGQVTFEGTLNADQSNRAFYSWYGAQFGSLEAVSIPVGYPADLFAQMQAVNASATPTGNMGFVFDPTPVQNEVAACSAKAGEYTTNFVFGFVETDQLDTVLAEMRQGLIEAGIEKVVAEVQRQLDEFRK